MSKRREIFKAVGFAFSGSIVGAAFGYDTGTNIGSRRGYEHGREDGIRQAGGIEPTQAHTNIRSENRDLTLNPGDYHGISLTFPKETFLIYSVTANSHLDIVFMTQKDFNKYENDNDPDYLMRYSDLDTSRAIRDQVIQSGDYVLVLDNTQYGRATPSKRVKVGYSLGAYQRSSE